MTFTEFGLEYQYTHFVVKGTISIFDLPTEFKKGETVPKFLVYNTYFNKKGVPNKKFETILAHNHPIYDAVPRKKRS